MTTFLRTLPLLAAAGMTLPAVADVLFDNGDPNGVGGTSNATSGVFGFRRTLLDDFTVPHGETWRIDTFRHRHCVGHADGRRGGHGDRDHDLARPQDLVDLLVLWGPCDPPEDCPGDFDGSGAVDFGDVLIVISSWRPCGS